MSKALDKSIKTGRFFSKGLFFKKTGVISANFNLFRKRPVLKVLLKGFCKIGAVELARFLRIFAEVSF